ncbi:MAG: hypothetical protein AABX03_02105 [Nanoarchaeota archaeon]
MENTEKQVKRRFDLTSYLLGVGSSIAVVAGAHFISSHPVEEPRITRTVYQSYDVQLNEYSYRTVVIMEDTKTSVKIHGEDRSNDGSIDFSENIMGYPGTGNNKKVLQEAYDALRKR